MTLLLLSLAMALGASAAPAVKELELTFVKLENQKLANQKCGATATSVVMNHLDKKLKWTLDHGQGKVLLKRTIAVTDNTVDEHVTRVSAKEIGLRTTFSRIQGTKDSLDLTFSVDLTMPVREGKSLMIDRTRFEDQKILKANQSLAVRLPCKWTADQLDFAKLNQDPALNVLATYFDPPFKKANHSFVIFVRPKP